MDGDGQIQEDSINFNIGGIAYIDRIKDSILEKIESKCDLWKSDLEKQQMNTTSLRTEWILEHKNLIDRLDSFIKQYESDKEEINKHFIRQNDLQNVMKDLQKTFATFDKMESEITNAILTLSEIYAKKDDIDKKISISTRNIWASMCALWGLLAIAFISHILGYKI